MDGRESTMGIVVLCPLEVERAAVSRAVRSAALGHNIEVRRCGPGGAAATRAVAAIAPGQVRAVVLAGVAGGLSEVSGAPRVGRVVDGRDGVWRCRIGAGDAVVAGVDEVVRSAAEKRALRERTGADLVDMESHAFAAACEARGLRWGVVRGVSDRADEALPAEATGWVDAQGRTRVGRVLMDVLRRPRLVGALARLGRRSGAAMRAVGAEVVRLIEEERKAAACERGLGGLVDGARAVILFGGTFDPPHLGHTVLPERVRAAAEAWTGPQTWLVYVPAARSPFKEEGPVASDEDRLEMLRRAVAGIPRAAVWTGEIERARGDGEPSYTVDTVRNAMSQIGEGVALRLLIGADQAAEFHRWRKPREIIEMAEPLVMLRAPEESVGGLLEKMRASGAWSEEELRAWAGRVVEVGTMDVSATRVREELMKGERDRGVLKGMVGEGVLAVIEARGLYGGSART